MEGRVEVSVLRNTRSVRQSRVNQFDGEALEETWRDGERVPGVARCEEGSRRSKGARLLWLFGALACGRGDAVAL